MLLKKICKELGVEIGEEWTGNDGGNYVIGKTGEIFEFDDDGFCIGSNYDEWEKIFKGDLKPIWKPKKGETYYTPRLNHHKKERFITRVWTETEVDYFYFHNNMAFKTKEECNRKSQEIIDRLGVIK